MNRFNRRLILGSALFALTSLTHAAPPEKDICPAPANSAAQRAAVQAACRHFNGVPKSWGLHSAFNAAGQIVNCIHFSCKPAPQQANPGPQNNQDAAAPKRFQLKFRDAYLVHEPSRPGLQIAAQGNVLSYGNDWKIKRLKPYLFQVKQNNWRNFHWQINTSRKSVHRVKGGQFGQLGGNKKKLNMGVDVVGDGMNPTRYFLRFNDAYLVHKPGSRTLQVAAQGNVLSYGSDWKVRQLKPYLYQLKQNAWQNFFWEVNTSRKIISRVKGASFGQLGGNDTKLNIRVKPVY